MKKTLIVMLSIFLFISCDEEDNDFDIQNETVIVNNTLYKEAVTNNYKIKEVTLNGNLLTLKISSGGCSGESWKAVLFDANEILESNPIQRNIKLFLENNEACLAVFEKEFTFDISILKKEHDQVILNLHAWNNQINYN